MTWERDEIEGLRRERAQEQREEFWYLRPRVEVERSALHHEAQGIAELTMPSAWVVEQWRNGQAGRYRVAPRGGGTHETPAHTLVRYRLMGWYCEVPDGYYHEHAQPAAGSIRAATQGHGALPHADRQPDAVLGNGAEPERAGQPRVPDRARPPRQTTLSL